MTEQTKEEVPEMFMTINEVAARLRVHRRTIERMITSGELPAFKASKSWRIKRADVDAIVNGGKTE